MKAVVAAFNQEKALVGAFSVITNLRMEIFEALLTTAHGGQGGGWGEGGVLTNCNTGPVGTRTWHQSHHLLPGHTPSRMHLDSLRVYCLYLEVSGGQRSPANVLFCCYVLILLS